MFNIVNNSIDFNKLKQDLSNPRAGACVIFEGWVRNHHEGKDVQELEYDTYESLCFKEAKVIEKECFEKFDIVEINCVHRSGVCEIGDMAVWIGVTAEHRGDAFKGCEYMINQLKVRLPIWKKEFFVEGDPVWVRCDHCAEYAKDTHSH